VIATAHQNARRLDEVRAHLGLFAVNDGNAILGFEFFALAFALRRALFAFFGREIGGLFAFGNGVQFCEINVV